LEKLENSWRELFLIPKRDEINLVEGVQSPVKALKEEMESQMENLIKYCGT
jgi:hypothetical protein